MKNPMLQFKIVDLIPLKIAGLNVSFTNMALVLTIGFILSAIYLICGIRKQSVIPGFWQSSTELLYVQTEEMMQGIIGPNNTRYLPFVFSVFVFVLMCNLMGMVPYSFSVTSHIAATFMLASVVFIVINIIGFVNHGMKYFSIFLPEGIPLPLMPLLLIIELTSYLTRPFSLSMRLMANMLAGHMILKVFAGFIIMAGSVSMIIGSVPFVLLTIMNGFEIFIALLQAYIFALLTCVYLNDAINLH